MTAFAYDRLHAYANPGYPQHFMDYSARGRQQLSCYIAPFATRMSLIDNQIDHWDRTNPATCYIIHTQSDSTSHVTHSMYPKQCTIMHNIFANIYKFMIEIESPGGFVPSFVLVSTSLILHNKNGIVRYLGVKWCICI